MEAAAIARAQGGDWDGIHFLYARYADDVLAYVVSVGHDRLEAEDVTQTVFAELHRTIRRYEEREGAFLDFLFGAARSAALRATEGATLRSPARGAA